MLAAIVRLALVLAVTLALPGCAGAGACTEIGCESEATVVYNGFSINGPYDLNLDLGGEKLFLRCNDAGSMEEVDNPEFVECDPGGFRIVGPDSNKTSILVTIFDIDADAEIAVNQTVQLAVDPENGVLMPNGPDCEPVCYVRSGAVLP